MGKAIAVSTKKGDKSIQTFITSFSAGDGRDVAMVFSYENWAAFDDDGDFSESYEEMYGDGSWKEFLEIWTSSTKGIVQVVTKLVE